MVVVVVVAVVASWAGAVLSATRSININFIADIQKRQVWVGFRYNNTRWLTILNFFYQFYWAPPLICSTLVVDDGCGVLEMTIDIIKILFKYVCLYVMCVVKAFWAAVNPGYWVSAQQCVSTTSGLTWAHASKPGSREATTAKIAPPPSTTVETLQHPSAICHEIRLIRAGPVM